MADKFIRVLILTVNNVYKHINIKKENFNKKYEKRGKYPEDKRKITYSKKAEYYQKENVPMNLRRIKRRAPSEYEEAQDDYFSYLEAKEEQEKAARERKIERKKAEKEKRKQAQRQQEETKINQPVRVWMKLKYTGDNPIFIEAFIDGRIKDEASLKEQLQEFIMSNFGEGIGLASEIGIENISRPEQTSPEIRYKHSLREGWNIL